MQKLEHLVWWRRAVVAVGLLFVLVFGIQAIGGPGAAQQASAQTVLQVSAGGPYSGTAGFPVSMNATVAGAVNPQFSWNFGDGSFGAGQFTSHVYSSAGVFPVTVSVTDLATGQTAAASSSASITGNASCVPGVTVPVGTVCSNITTCVPGVTVPFGTACSNIISCGFGVSVLIGTACPTVTNCGFGVSAFFGTGCAVGLSCSVGAAALFASACGTGTSCIPGLSIACPSFGVTTALGCTSGQAPCAVGQTCTPISSNQVFCTNAGQTTTTSSAPSTTAATTTVPVETASGTPPTVGSCAPYDSTCAYCANHSSASICKPQQ